MSNEQMNSEIERPIEPAARPGGKVRRSKGRKRVLGMTTLVLATFILSGLLAWRTQQLVTMSGSEAERTNGAAMAAEESQTELGVVAVAGADGAAMYDEPGGTLIRSVPTGEVLTASGRTTDGGWIMVLDGNQHTGWILSEELVLAGIDQLPVLADGMPAAEPGDSALASDETGETESESPLQNEPAVDDASSSSAMVDNKTEDSDQNASPSGDEVAGGEGESDSGAMSDSGAVSGMANEETAADAATEMGENVEQSAHTDGTSSDGMNEAMSTSPETEVAESSRTDSEQAPSQNTAADVPASSAPQSEAPATATQEETAQASGAVTDSAAIDVDATSDAGRSSANDLNTLGQSSTQNSSEIQLPSITSSVLAVVRQDNSPLVIVPEGQLIEELPIGESLFVIGRAETNDWLRVQTDGGNEGWVSANNVVAFRIQNVPVMPLEPASAMTSATEDPSEPTSTDQPATAATQTDANSSAMDSPSGSTSANSAPSATEDVSTTGGTVSTDSGLQPDTSAATSVSVASSSTARVSNSITQLNVRSGPGMSYGALSKINANDVVSVIGRDRSGFWILIEDPRQQNSTGWVSANYVIIDRSGGPLPTVDLSGNVISDNSSRGAEPSAPSDETQVASASPVPGISGKLAILSKLGGTIYIYDFATGALRPLTTGFDPSISPSGQQVAFTRLGGSGGLYVINMDGSNERRIYASDQAPRAPSWSPDERYIVFSRLTGEYKCTNLGFGLCVKNNRFLDDFPQIIKDERGLSRIDLDGENFRDLPALNTANAPHWTSRGIVYQASTSIEITQDGDDDANRAVINQVIGYYDPSWQPGGGRIVFQAKEGSHWEIFGINPDGSGIAALTRPVTTLVDELPSNVSPTWSPNGRYVAYVSNRDQNNSAGDWRIWLMNGDGSNQRPLPLNISVDYAYNLEQMVSWGP